MTESNPPFVGGQVPLELKEALEKAAKELDLSMAQILRRALTEWVKENQAPNKTQQDNKDRKSKP